LNPFPIAALLIQLHEKWKVQLYELEYNKPPTNAFVDKLLKVIVIYYAP
jgi:hypothetical protein